MIFMVKMMLIVLSLISFMGAIAEKEKQSKLNFTIIFSTSVIGLVALIILGDKL